MNSVMRKGFKVLVHKLFSSLNARKQMVYGFPSSVKMFCALMSRFMTKKMRQNRICDYFSQHSTNIQDFLLDNSQKDVSSVLSIIFTLSCA